MNKKIYRIENRKNQEILNRIAKEVSEVKLFERKRKFSNLKQFTSIIMGFAKNSMSVRTLSEICKTKYQLEVSDTAFKKIFQKCDKFKEIYENLLNTRENKMKTKKILGNKACFLLDTTSLKEEGINNEVYRIHTSYGLTKNQISQVKVTNSHIAESVQNFEIQENALYFADRAYATGKQMSHILDKNADFIFRFKINGVVLYSDSKCKIKFDLSRFLSKTKKDEITKVFYIKYNNTIKKIRIIANRSNEETTKKSIKKSQKRATKKGQKIKDSTMKMCEWFILVTSFVGKFTSKQIFKAYRIRWQIELLFKRFKTFINLHKIRKSTSNYAFSYIFISLILWFVLEFFVEVNKDYFQKYSNQSSSSLWLSFAISSFICPLLLFS